MQQIAFGHLHMSPDDFWNSTQREFFNRLFGNAEIEKRNFEIEQMNYRMIMYWMLLNNPYIDKKDKPKSFEDFNKGFEKEPGKKIENTMSKETLLSLMGIKEER